MKETNRKAVEEKLAILEAKLAETVEELKQAVVNPLLYYKKHNTLPFSSIKGMCGRAEHYRSMIFALRELLKGE